MASSLYFPGKYWFYPIGNTSAVCLTRDVPPDLPVSILLLPCGDPRNVLYTVYCEHSNRLGRTLDFTCSDFDPGVLARNVLLLTMIMDRVATPTMWNIFFHMYLDIDSRSTLVSQSQKLAAYDSMDSWRSSPYGAIVKIGTDHTLSELRRHWELYADFYHPSKLHRLRTLQGTMQNKLKKNSEGVGFSITSARSAGPLFIRYQTNGLIASQFRRYWETGTTFTDKRALAATTHPNSTFFYSRAHEGFDVHYGTDPMIPFHHAALLGNTKRTFGVGDLVESAKTQFKDWCSAFQSATTTEAGKMRGAHGALVVRFVLGDALAVARALRDCPEPVSVHVHPFSAPKVALWTTSVMKLNLEEYTNLGAPSRFDVIDTSNLSDHIGMLNMLLAAAPLLAGSPSSVLYTETLLTHADDPSTELESKLFASLPIVATLMDLAPVDALSGFTTRCNTHELLSTGLYTYADEDKARQHHQTLTWRRPSGGDHSTYRHGCPHPPMSFDTRQLAQLLHTIYVRLYKSEDPMSLLNTDRGDLLGSIRRSSSTCPSREAIVVLLDFIRTHLQISPDQWSDVVTSFLSLRSQDPTPTRLFDRLGDSELHAQLHRYGLYAVPGPDQVHRPRTGRLSLWTSIPPLVRVFLTVPRTHLAKLESVSQSVPTPWLRCAIGTPQGEHIFQSVDAAFGKLTRTGTTPEPRQDLSFQEEADGLKNGSDLVFSFVVPGRVLVEAPTSTISIALTVRADPVVVRILTPVLGLALCVFRASLQDADYVHLLPEQPLRSQVQPKSGLIPPEGSELDGLNTLGRQQPVRVDLDGAGKRVTSLTAKLDITNTTAQADFAGGVTPDVSQCSPCAIQIDLGGRTQTLAYPMPIVGSRRKVRFARKSSYIEVVVPVAIPFLEPDGFKLNPFPVIRANTSLSPWNIHRVFLDSLPILNITKANVSQLQEWYNPHVGSQLCMRERASLKDPVRPDVLANIKETIHCIMMRCAGTQGSQEASRTFALRDDASGDCDTLLFVDKVRFDLSAHAMVCDAFVLPLCHALMPRIEQAFQQLLRRGGIENVKLYGQEMRAWKRLLPALVERCRASWVHGANCEYAAQGRIPLEVELSEGDPLCGCGRGKDVEGMLRDAVWKRFAPFVTRVALSPLFAVSYMEPVFEGLGREMAGALTRASQDAREADGKIEATSSLARCRKCAKEEAGDLTLLRCSRCKTTLYCSEACQKADWKAHKLQCGK
ncbi:hypothetical protein GSI_10199 [Ganoderma sinense ZZ0214-1]|uniref:MYND-type domain-containing protein n=1 Tax=Ganoderma sinense ZZ0214-1 TaxID=1077348 RepID=A0A2G8RZW4_9APHY|nr:hypothetical protein GSI_10199 [Ganoderma sinense ZZ0214-1]